MPSVAAKNLATSCQNTIWLCCAIVLAKGKSKLHSRLQLSSKIKYFSNSLNSAFWLSTLLHLG